MGRHGLGEAGGEEWRPEAATRRRESSNGRVVEAGEAGEGASGSGRLEDVGSQHRVTAGPGHLLPLVLHPPVLEPDLDKDLRNKGKKCMTFNLNIYHRLKILMTDSALW